MTHWELLEADFRREYQLDIPVALQTMSWRRFRALVAGLSDRSTFWAAIQRRERRQPLENPAQIAAALRSRRGR